MTNDEIKDWALKSGFAAEAPSVLLAPYGDARVRLTFMRTNIRIEIEKEFDGGTRSHRIGTYRPKDATLDSDGMLNGIGLGGSFLMSFGRDASERPVWMPENTWNKWVSANQQPDVLAVPGVGPR